MKKGKTFTIESLFDKRGKYTAHCSKSTGEILFHTSGGEARDEDEPEAEQEAEQVSANQMKMF